LLPGNGSRRADRAAQRDQAGSAGTGGRTRHRGQRRLQHRIGGCTELSGPTPVRRSASVDRRQPDNCPCNRVIQ
jgi:hypothetical protein